MYAPWAAILGAHPPCGQQMPTAGKTEGYGGPPGPLLFTPLLHQGPLLLYTMLWHVIYAAVTLCVGTAKQAGCGRPVPQAACHACPPHQVVATWITHQSIVHCNDNNASLISVRVFRLSPCTLQLIFLLTYMQNPCWHAKCHSAKRLTCHISPLRCHSSLERSPCQATQRPCPVPH